MFSRAKAELKAEPGAGRWPWEPDQSVAAQLAIGSLLKFFPKSLARNGRLQVETLFCVIGALTGFAAQYAVRQEHVASGNATEAEVFVVAQAPNGERYYFGDRLNAVLVPETLESIAVLSILGGEALKLGVAKEELPRLPRNLRAHGQIDRHARLRDSGASFRPQVFPHAAPGRGDLLAGGADRVHP